MFHKFITKTTTILNLGLIHTICVHGPRTWVTLLAPVLAGHTDIDSRCQVALQTMSVTITDSD